MRKLISILLVLVMVLSLTVPALATGDTTATTEGVLDGGADITVDAETDATPDTEGMLDGGADITVDAEAGDATDTIGAAPAETEPVPIAADDTAKVRAEADQNLIIYAIVIAVLTVLALVAVLIKMHQMKKEN